MILVINICRDSLHYYEFVKPVVDILKDEEVLILHYEDLVQKDLEYCDRVIICGTSLADNKYIKDIKYFFWLKDFKKPVLGICAGFQILGMVFGGKIEKALEIGFFKEKFDKNFLGLEGEIGVYHLHRKYIKFSKDWRIFNKGDIVQAIKLNNFYGVLFHPEVRNKDMFLNFVKL